MAGRAALSRITELTSGAAHDLHLVECDGCEHYLQQFRTTVDTLGRIGDDAIEPAFRDRLLDALRDWR